MKVHKIYIYKCLKSVYKYIKFEKYEWITQIYERYIG